jgi:hypothetical protein
LNQPPDKFLEEDIRRWLAQAKEVRAAAIEMVDPQARDKMLLIAEDLERLARRAEQGRRSQ